MMLRSAVDKVVIRVLEDFGAVSCTYRPNPVISEFKDRVAFEIMPLGTALLDSLVIQEG